MDSCLEQLKKTLESAVAGMSSEQLRWRGRADDILLASEMELQAAR